jgi:hypothetical protein
MQQYPLLQTKLFIPPIRPGLVSRSRLTERLNAGMDRKLTLVSAPAGFGKTTLISDWLAGCQQPAAWLSLDESDNDPTRFLVLQPYLPRTAHEVARVLSCNGQQPIPIAHHSGFGGRSPRSFRQTEVVVLDLPPRSRPIRRAVGWSPPVLRVPDHSR